MTSPVSPRIRVNTKALRGAEKAAALLLYMGKPLASRLLTQFDADELKQITRSIAELGTVPVPAL
jgi:flagellar motor switch protein FliG